MSPKAIFPGTCPSPMEDLKDETQLVDIYEIALIQRL